MIAYSVFMFATAVLSADTILSAEIAFPLRGRDGDARPDARRHRSNETKWSVYGGVSRDG